MAHAGQLGEPAADRWWVIAIVSFLLVTEGLFLAVGIVWLG